MAHLRRSTICLTHSMGVLLFLTFTRFHCRASQIFADVTVRAMPYPNKRTVGTKFDPALPFQQCARNLTVYSLFLSFLLSLFCYLCLLIVLCFKHLWCMDFLSSDLNEWYLISLCSVVSLLWGFHGNRQLSLIGLFLGYVQAVFNESVLVLGADLLVHWWFLFVALCWGGAA
jgi:hypothetical protein